MSAEDGRVRVCRLPAIEIAGRVLMDAVEDGGTWIFPLPGDALTELDAGDCEVRRRRIAGSHVIHVAGRGARLDGSEIVPGAAETGLLAGENVLLGLRNGQDAGTVLDWVGWHVETHGATAALIVDRGSADDADRLADVLRREAPAGIRRILIVRHALPLGVPGAVSEHHPVHAPERPGHVTCEGVPPDPWRAPLGWGGLHEALRRRFLSRSRGVVCLDLSDLLAPPEPGTAGIFDAVRASEAGHVLLAGRCIYPWKLSGRAGYGDHVCRAFDRNRGPRRWAVDPARDAAVWRLVRVTGLGKAAGTRAFWRAMAIRHPGAPLSQLVPRASLVEAEELLEIGRRLSQVPRRPPSPPRRRSRDRRRVVAVTCMKNEGPFILDWIAHHRAVGIERFLVYTNDCTDGTDGMLDLLARKGLVEHRQNPFRETGMKPQHAALRDAAGRGIVTSADWIVSMDVDEYIAVHVGDGTLGALFEAVPEANVISMTWRLFGNAHRHRFEDLPVTGLFTQAAPEMMRKPHQAWGFKTLYRNDGLFAKPGVHRPKGILPGAHDRIRWVGGSGDPMPQGEWRTAWRSTPKTVGYDLVSLNHYAVRSAESFLVKRDRGRVNHVARDQGLAYWFRMNTNVVTDTRLAAFAAGAEERARLFADPEIAAAHAAAVDAHRLRISALIEDPGHRALYDAITGARLERLSERLVHFGKETFEAGPDVIPDEIVFADLPDGFVWSPARVA